MNSESRKVTSSCQISILIIKLIESLTQIAVHFNLYSYTVIVIISLVITGDSYSNINTVTL